MNQLKNERYLPFCAAVAGGFALLTRLWMFTGGMESGGLLKPGHIAQWLLALLCVAAAVASGLYAWKMPKGGNFGENFPRSIPGAVGACAAGAGILAMSMAELMQRARGIGMLCALLGILAAASLAFTGYCRLTGRRPNFLFHGIVCVYAALTLVRRYQFWSANSQPLTFLCPLLGTACLMLYAYHRAAFDLNLGKRGALTFYGLLGSFFCVASLIREGNWLFFAAGAVWMLTGLCHPNGAEKAEAKKEEPSA